jgi:hypothetical protein
VLRLELMAELIALLLSRPFCARLRKPGPAAEVLPTMVGKSVFEPAGALLWGRLATVVTR